MKKLIVGLMMALTLTGCLEESNSNKSTQSAKAAEAANSIVFKENAEIDNIKRRLELTSNPGAVGFILLLNEAGQPIMYTAVKGKVSSSGKRLTEPDRVEVGPNNRAIRAAASDEGTYGSSDPYIFFWTMNGQYVQWSGNYLYSDKPIRVKIEPLVINVEGKE